MLIDEMRRALPAETTAALGKLFWVIHPQTFTGRNVMLTLGHRVDDWRTQIGGTALLELPCRSCLAVATISLIRAGGDDHILLNLPEGECCYLIDARQQAQRDRDNVR